MTGINDPSALMNIIRGGSVKWQNQMFGTGGAINSGSLVTLNPPGEDEYIYWCIIFSNLKYRNVLEFRTGGHDPQALEVFHAQTKEYVLEKIKTMLDAARAYGIKVTITLGGFSDTRTCATAYDLFDRTSPRYQKHVALASYLADECQNDPSLKGIELLNEPDFMTAIKGYWLKQFPTAGQTLVAGFCGWQDAIMNEVRAKQKKPGIKINMGTAIDGTLYCDINGNPMMDWLAEIARPNVLLMALKGMDEPTAHIYLNENSDAHRKVFYGQKIPAFLATVNKLNKNLLIGETGGLWVGGIYDDGLNQCFNQYPKITPYWMVRFWNPQDYTTPTTFPVRTSYAPSTEEDNNTVPPSSDSDTVEPSPTDPSSPGTTDEDTEGKDKKYISMIIDFLEWLADYLRRKSGGSI